MKILVIGSGSIGTRHATNLLAHAEVALLDKNFEKVRTVAEDVGAKYFSEIEKAWEWRADGVIVAVPNHLHMEYANQAIEHGIKTILIEKPISHSLDGVQDLIKKAEQKNVSVFVVTNMRFHNAIQVLKKNIDRIGKPLFAQGHVGNYLPNMRPGVDYRTVYAAHKDQGGGTLLDAIHEIDYMSWLFGKVKRVFAHTATLSDLEIDVEDYAAVILIHATGVRTVLTMDYLQQCKRRGCEIIGTEGTLVWQSEGKVPEHCLVKLFDKQTGSWEILLELDSVDISLAYEKLIEEFVLAIKNDENNLASAKDGYDALDVVLAAHRSSETQCSVIIK